MMNRSTALTLFATNPEPAKPQTFQRARLANDSKPDSIRTQYLADFSAALSSTGVHVELPNNTLGKLSDKANFVQDGKAALRQVIKTGEEAPTAKTSPSDSNPWADTRVDMALEDLPIPMPPPAPVPRGASIPSGGLWK